MIKQLFNILKYKFVLTVLTVYLNENKGLTVFSTVFQLCFNCVNQKKKQISKNGIANHQQRKQTNIL